MSVNIKPYIIINGKNSNEITGLMITKLPPISKPAMRVEAEEIDGRDGDIVTELGFSAYDKEIEIGLYGEYDVNDVIEYFNQSGQVIFSNEPDKYYRFAIYNAIDFEKLINFKTATVTFHVQPFKFDVESNDAVFFSPSNVSITNEGNIYSRPELAIQGSGNVGISVNGSDVLEIELGASQQAIIIDSDGMNAYGTKSNIKELIVDVNPVQDLHGYDHPWAGGAGKNKFNIVNYEDIITNYDVILASYRIKAIPLKPNTTYTVSQNAGTADSSIIMLINYVEGVNASGYFDCRKANDTKTYTTDETGNLYIGVQSTPAQSAVNARMELCKIQIEEGTTATAWTPYENICPISGWNGCDVTRTGANMLNGHAMAQALANNGGTINTSEKTISYSGAVARATGIYMTKFKPDTRYTVIFKVKSSNKNCNALFNYTDGTSTQISVPDATTGEFTFVVASTNGKSVSNFSFGWLSGTVVAYYEECGIFEGVLTADDFQRYVGNQYQSFFEGLINGTMGFVDLGTLNWNYVSTGNRFSSTGISSLVKAPASDSTMANVQAKGFTTMTLTALRNSSDDYLIAIGDTGNISVRYTSAGTDATEFTTAMSGIYLIYELATPTTPTITQADINMLMTAFGIDEESAIVVFGQEVFGATINITTGLLKIDRQIVEMSTITYNAGFNGYYTTIYANVIKLPDTAENSDLICSCYKVGNAVGGDNLFIQPSGTYAGYIIIRPSATFADANAFRTSLQGQQLVYPLANPIEVQLTAQEIMSLIGKNVLWANTGDINELIYTKDGVDITTSGDIVSFDVDAIDIKDNILKNRLVTGNYDGLRLKAGTNQIAVSGNVNVMVLSNFSRWL